MDCVVTMMNLAEFLLDMEMLINYLDNPIIIFDKSLLTPLISILFNYTFPFPVILNFIYVSISLLILFYVFQKFK